MLLPPLPHVIYAYFIYRCTYQQCWQVHLGPSCSLHCSLLGALLDWCCLRVKRKEKSLDNVAVRIECAEKREELPGDESVARDDSEQWTDKAALHYEQHVEDLHYESTDVLGQGCHGKVEGSGVRSEGEQCDVTDAADVLLKDGVGHSMKEIE